MNILNLVTSFVSTHLRGRTSPPDPQDRSFWGVPFGRNTAREAVTSESALGVVAVWAAIGYVSGQIMQMPWRIIETAPDATKRLAMDHPAWRLLMRAPNPEMTPGQFKELLVAWMMGWGNGYAEIARDILGRPVELWPIHPSRVRLARDENDMLVYVVRNDNQADTVLVAQDMFHAHGLGFDGLCGYNPVVTAANALGCALAADKYAGSFYGNGANPIGYLSFQEYQNDETRDVVRRAWYQAYGGTELANQIAVLHSGAKFEKIDIDPHAAQLLESRQWSVREIARLFNVPPSKIQDYEGVTMAGLEEINSQVVTDTLGPWITRLEEQANTKILGQQRFSTKLYPQALLRGTSTARWRNYQLALQLGVMSVNEVRALEDLNGIGADGDVYRMPMNMMTSEQFVARDIDSAAPIPPGPGDGSSGGLNEAVRDTDTEG